jgi:hypothetical protein
LLTQWRRGWAACEPAFCQRRTWERSERLALSLLACLGRRTVTNVVAASGRQALDWTADYRFFSEDRWTPEDLFDPVIGGILEGLPPGAPFVASVDDTHRRKTGRHIPGIAYARDPMSPPFHVNLIRGQRFLQLTGLRPALDGAAMASGSASPARGIPLRFLAAPPAPKPGSKAPPEAWAEYRRQQRLHSLSQRAVGAMAELRHRLDTRFNQIRRTLLVCGDGSYTNRIVLRGLPSRTTFIGRIRSDAKLHALPAPADAPAGRGRRRRYGPQRPTPEQIRQDDSVPWQAVRAFAAGQVREFRVKTLSPVLWRKAGCDLPVRIVVIAPVGYRLRHGSRLLYRKPAYLVCTDPDMPLAALLQYYIWRWEIEVNHRDEKQLIGVGEAQVRDPASVERVPAFAVAAYAHLLLAGERAFDGETAPARALPKWRARDPKPRLSTLDFLHELRKELWGNALRPTARNFLRFVRASTPDTKPSKFIPSLMASVLTASGP